MYRLAGSISWNPFLGSLNFYKYGLRSHEARPTKRMHDVKSQHGQHQHHGVKKPRKTMGKMVGKVVGRAVLLK
jgi:hypothetical protein